MRARARSVAVALAVAFAGSACASGSAEAVVFRYAFTEGETRTYELRTDMDLDTTSSAQAPDVSFTGSMTATMTVTTEEVRDDGTTVLKVVMTDVEFTLEEGAQAPPIPDETEAKITIGPDGTVVSVDGTFGAFGLSDAAGSLLGDANPGDNTAPQMLFPRFPDREIGPGDTWSETTEVPLGVGGASVEVRTDGRHDGFEDTDFGRAAKITASVEVPMDLELPFGELFSGLAESLGAHGGQATVPPDYAEAKMVMTGTTTGETTSLVIPENADAVRVDGTMTLDQHLTFEDFPQPPGGKPLQDVTVAGTIRIAMERVS